MKLIKVEYSEGSSEGIFFDVMFEKKGFFTMPKIYNKSYFKFSDNTGGCNFDRAIVQEMILQYEKRK